MIGPPFCFNTFQGFHMKTAFFILAAFLLLPACSRDRKEEVRAVLKEEPGLVLEVLKENKAELLEIMEEGLAERDVQKRRRQWKLELENPLIPVIQEGRPVKGDKNAPVTIVEYSDFKCPYCAKASATIFELLEKYPDKVRLIFKHYPLHKDSSREAAIFEAIALQDQEKAWEFKKMLFAAYDRFMVDGETVVNEILDGLNLDRERLEEDVRSAKIQELIADDEAETKFFAFKGAPTFLVNGVGLRGAAPLKEFEQLLYLVQTKDSKGKQCTDCDEVPKDKK